MHISIYYLAVILGSERVKRCRVWICFIPRVLLQLEWLHFLLISFCIKYVENVGIPWGKPLTAIIAVGFLLMDYEINRLLVEAVL